MPYSVVYDDNYNPPTKTEQAELRENLGVGLGVTVWYTNGESPVCVCRSEPK